MRYFFCLLILFLAGHVAIGQNQLFDSLYTLLKTHPDHDTTRVRILLQICYQEYTSYPEKSKAHADEAQRLSEELGFPSGKADAIRYIALYYWGNGNYEKATGYAYESLRIFESISDIKGIGQCYMLLGSIYKEQSDFEKAKDFHFKALEVFKKTKEKSRIAYVYNHLGVLFLNSSNYDLALENFQRSMELRKDLNDLDGLSQSYVNLASVYASQKKYAEALKYFEKSLSLLKEIDNAYRIIVILEGMGFVYTNTGNYGKAESNLLKALALAKSIHYKKKTEDIYTQLVFLEQQRRKFEKALEYAEVRAIYHDSIYNEDKTRQIAEIEIQYETEKKDQAIELLERDSKIQQLWTLILIAAFILLSILSVVIYLLQRYRNKKNRQILNLEIEYLTTQQRELSEKHKNILTSATEKPLESQDQRLLKKMIEVVENNMSDPSFGVDKMAIEIGMSRTSMHRKIKAITGFPPSELIRSIRLRKAAVLLINQTDSVAQIGFAVGFEDHSYFSKAFKKQFGVPPSDYFQSRNQMRS